MHGGAAPQVRHAATIRYERARVESFVATVVAKRMMQEREDRRRRRAFTAQVLGLEPGDPEAGEIGIFGQIFEILAAQR